MTLPLLADLRRATAAARAAAFLASARRGDPPTDEPAGGRADEGAHEDEVEAHAGGASRLTSW